MAARYFIRNAKIINEGKSYFADIALAEGRIEAITAAQPDVPEKYSRYEKIDATGKILIPGVIDDQVHFREPGLTYKGDIYSESRAAVAGGITSFMEMPNTIPNTLTQDLLEEKYAIAAEKSLANYSFYMGASNDNSKEVLKTDPKNVCGIKVFMGSSTGNMLVDDEQTLERIFSEAPCLVAVHCEHEPTIQKNINAFLKQYGIDAPANIHPLIRNAEACYRSSAKAVELAAKYNTRLHVLHLSSAEEMSLFSNNIPLSEKRITAEVCLHHLWFSDEDYASKGNFIKWNPAVKSAEDRDALWKALMDGRLDVVATDHAPHSFEEKSMPYFKSPSGGPMVQHLLPGMLAFYKQGKISLEMIVEKMCHNPAITFNIEKRGFIREGYFADLVLVDLDKAFTVNKENIFYKCGWSPMENTTLPSSVTHTFVNGNLVYENGLLHEEISGMRLKFDRN
ncbi:MAG: dihydroorotase [Bacteroidetes bacterium]|jgi:dihydroorotase|nr:dihydroorotase [Bacteroidota bacterium]